MKRKEIKVTDDEVTFLLEAGFICRDAGRYREAEDIFKGLVALLPEIAAPKVALGSVYLAQGKLDEALREYGEAVKLNPNSAYARAHLGEALLLKRQHKQAADELSKAVQLDPDGPNGKMARALMDLARVIG